MMLHIHVTREAPAAVAMVALLNLAIPSSAFAYVDPGTGSVMLQLIIGIALGVGIAAKVCWSKLKNLFSKKRFPPECDGRK